MIKIGNKEYTHDDIQALKTLADAFKNTPTGSTPTATPAYGPYPDGSGQVGVFSQPGFRREMFSAFQRPRTLAAILGVNRSEYTNEKIGIMTGVTEGSGDNADDFCDDAPTPGQLKLCMQNYTFGSWKMQTKLDSLPEMGERYDRADMEHIIANLPNASPFIPDIMRSLNLGNRAGLRLANELFTLGVEMERTFDQVVVQGDQTVTGANRERGWITEFDGLEQQITTGKVDLNTQVACPAVDSQVVTWNAGVDATVNGRTFPEALTDTVFGLRDIARQTGFGPNGVQWALIMPMRMHRALSYVWACEYWTNRCTGSAGNPVNQNARDVAELQRSIMNDMTLPIDGMNYPVIHTDGIRETRIAPGTYSADSMFVLPLTSTYGRLLRMEYKPMDNADIVSFANFSGSSNVRSINNGMYLVGRRDTPFCVEYHFAAKMRLIQDAPFLAARIDDINYQYLAPHRSAYPSDTISYVNGGQTYWGGNIS